MARKIIIETSARHIHLSKNDLAILFGDNYELTHLKDLSQPGEFATNERLTVVGPKGELNRVLVLGPLRDKTQVELSLTDARSIGVNAPIRNSGDTVNSGSCTLIGPNGSVELEEGVIVAKRHIHLTSDDAKEFNVTDKEIVNVKAESLDRSIIFGDVICRVSDKFSCAMHIDTDESNAAFGISEGTIIKK
jgi:Propanediol utilization protein